MQQTLRDDYIAKVNKYNTVASFITQSVEIRAAVPHLEDVLTRFNTIIAKIPSEAVERLTFKTAYSDVKPASREELAHKTFLAVKALLAVGRKQKVQELLNLPFKSESVIADLRYEDLINYCLSVKGLLTKYALGLVDSNYGAEKITAYSDMMDVYQVTLKNADVAKGKGEAATENIDRFIDDADDVFLELKDLVESLQDDYPDFFTAFKHIAQLREYGIRHEETPADPPPAPPAVP